MTTETRPISPLWGDEGVALTQRRLLIEDGSALAEIGHCGDDDLPCAVCDECVDDLTHDVCEISPADQPSPSWR